MPDQTTTQDVTVNVLLPALKKDRNIGGPKKAGEWVGVNADQLLAISNALDTKPAKLQINSIPDVWARLLLFESALFDKNDKLHNIILGEWRGLLAMLALREIKNINKLSAVSIAINTTVEDRNKVWHKSLNELVPKTQVFQNTNWSNLFVFTVDGKPVGITSPTTLVATSTDYSHLTLTRSQVSWYDGKTFQDPTQLDKSGNTYLSDNEKNALAWWLDNLFNKLNDEAPFPVEENEVNRLNLLLDLVRNFKNDLIPNPVQVTLSKESLGMAGKVYGVFNYLDNPVEVPNNVVSHVKLVHSTEKNPKPIYLVDKDIADQWRKEPSEIAVHGADTLASIPYEGLLPNVHDKYGNKTINDAEIWRPQDLFTEELYYVEGSSAFSGTSPITWYQAQYPKKNEKGISIILPLDQKLLEHYTVADLLERLESKQESNGDITITLTIHLSSENPDNPQPYRIIKKYSSDIMKELETIPVLEIFPNFISDSWKAYYTAYYSENLKTTFQIEPFATNPKESIISGSETSNAKKSVWKTENFPEAFICSFRNERGAIPQKIGILLPLSPTSIENPNRTFTVGVDFGASGTMIYYSDGTVKEPLDFNQDRKLSVTQKSDIQKAEIVKFFLPEANIKPEFLTLYHDFNNFKEDKTDNNAPKEREPFLNGHIYYFSGILKLFEDNLFSDLKWGTDTKTKEFVKTYLSQICLQSVVELACRNASTINWRFSFPTAFSKTQTSAFKTIWKSIIEEISKITSITLTPPTELSESVAAAECFRDGGAVNEKVSTQSGVIFVDIGSSTSDVSIYQNNDLLSQFSLLYAGRDIFLNYLQKNLDVLSDLKVDISSLNTGIDKNFWVQMDSILKLESPAIFRQLPLAEDEPSIKAIKKYLAVGLSGLFYYLGLVVNQLVEKDRTYSGRIPHIYLAGNGSQMFHWLTYKTPIGEHPIKDLFEAVFMEAVKIDLAGVFNISVTERPKHEAAYGLVCQNILNANLVDKSVIAGESFSSDSEARQWSELLTDEILETKLNPPTQLEQLPKFIDTFNRFVKREKIMSPINFDKTIEDQVFREMKTLLGDTNSDEQKIVFILALKSLLNTLD